MILFQGAATALITPFTPDGSAIDFEALGMQIDYQIAGGIATLVIAGTTGEASSLDDSEYRSLVQKAIEAIDGRVPSIVGTGGNNTKKVIQNTQLAKALGADAALIVNPYYNKSTQEGLIAHYTAIHDATDIPILLYNVPGRTGMNIAPSTVLALSKLPRIIGVKEASNNFQQIVEIARLIPKDFALYSGNDDTIVPLLALGGHGVISVVSNLVPANTQALVSHYLKGEPDKSLELQLLLKPLIDALFVETSPSPVKHAMAYMGLKPGPLRLPMIEASEKTKRQVEACIDALRSLGRLS